MKQWLRQELPAVLRTDPGLQQFIRDLMARDFADKETTDARFERIFSELKASNERFERAFSELKASNERLERAFNELKASNEEYRKADKAERQRERAEDKAEIAQEFKRVDKSLTHLDHRIMAMGARWGIQAESTFREALRGILAESFGVKVENVTEYDTVGQVFGHPDQIELDIIIYNGLLLICEIKSSVSQGDIHLFERKARFYEERHGRKAQRLIVISPMVDERAKSLAKKLNVEIYTYADEVTK